ncbi:MAG: hypothetical protein IKO27_01680 [Ruminococcus sp.]|nr:hypothetical protein [Ruminococcus sp.]
MTYSVNKETILAAGDGVLYVRSELWVSAEEALPAYDAIEGRVLTPGSLAVIPSLSRIYVLDFDNTWKEWKK